MSEMLKEFWQEEDGIGTVELIIILVVLIGIAILFGETITGFVKTLIARINPEDVPNPLEDED